MVEANLATAYWTPIRELAKWLRNPRRNANAIGKVAQSIRMFGFIAAIVVWRSQNRIVAGHTRVAALESILAKEPNFVPRGAPGVGLVPVRFHEFADEAEANAYAIADNRLSEIAEWDEPLLGEHLAEIARLNEKLLDATGFDGGELDRLIREASGTNAIGEDPGPSKPPIHPVSRRGEVYELGPHLLMCGDSTSAADMTRLMNGEKAALLSTDPPYCVNYTGMDRPIHDGKPSGKDWSHLYREVDIADLGRLPRQDLRRHLAVVRDDAAVYVWHAHLQQPTIAAMFAFPVDFPHRIVLAESMCRLVPALPAKRAGFMLPAVVAVAERRRRLHPHQYLVQEQLVLLDQCA